MNEEAPLLTTGKRFSNAVLTEANFCAAQKIFKDRKGRHWKRSEIGLLIESVTDGATLESVAQSLHRTLKAVQSEWNRLLSGEVDCPPEYSELLEKLQKKYNSGLGTRDSGLVRPKSQSPNPQPQITEQYKQLSHHIFDLAGVIAEGRLLQSMMMARLIARGKIQAKWLRACGMSDKRVKIILNLASEFLQAENEILTVGELPQDRPAQVNTPHGEGIT